VTTSFNNPDHPEPGATSPITDGPVQDSQSVEEEHPEDEETQAHREGEEPPPAEEHD
jgi:hypothetical protein